MVGNDPKDPAALMRRWAVVLTPLGSAWLSVEMALEELSDKERARVHVSEAPLVEGAVLAAVIVIGTVLHVLTGRIRHSRPAIAISRGLALLVFGGTLVTFWLGVEVGRQ